MAIKTTPPTEKFKLGLGAGPNLKGMPLKRRPFKPGQMIVPKETKRGKKAEAPATDKGPMKELEWKKKTPVFKSNVNKPLTGKHFDKNSENPAEKAAQLRIGKALGDKKFGSEQERQAHITKIRGSELASINEENNLRAKPAHSLTGSQKFRLEQINARNLKEHGRETHPELHGDFSRSGIDKPVQEKMDRSTRSANPNDFGSSRTPAVPSTRTHSAASAMQSRRESASLDSEVRSRFNSNPELATRVMNSFSPEPTAKLEEKAKSNNLARAGRTGGSQARRVR